MKHKEPIFFFGTYLSVFSINAIKIQNLAFIFVSHSSTGVYNYNLIFFIIASPSQKDPMDAKDFSQGPKILNYYQKIQEWMVECIII